MKTQILLAGALLIAIFVAYIEKTKSSIPAPSVADGNEWKIEDVAPNVPISDVTPKSYDEALQQAKAAKKNLFLFFHADWCYGCKRMESEVLNDPKVKEELKKYVFYKVDTDKERPIADKYKLVSIPSCLVVDGSESLIKSQTGFMKVPEFLQWLKNSKRPLLNKLLK